MRIIGSEFPNSVSILALETMAGVSSGRYFNRSELMRVLSKGTAARRVIIIGTAINHQRYFLIISSYFIKPA
jgi:hypothetical protein